MIKSGVYQLVSITINDQFGNSLPSIYSATGKVAERFDNQTGDSVAALVTSQTLISLPNGTLYSNDRDFRLCVELLDHRGDHGRYLRRALQETASPGILSKMSDFMAFASRSELNSTSEDGVVLLTDGELRGTQDNPLNAEIPRLDTTLSAEEFINHLARVSGVGILTSNRAGRFDRTPIKFHSETPLTLRDALFLLTRTCGIEWMAEVTPASMTVKTAPPGSLLVQAPKGFITLQIAN